jgi:hypothetical protein
MGQVRSTSGQPVANANVSINTVPQTTVQTDAQGLFTVSSIYEGSYNISISAPGFAIYNQNLDVAQSLYRKVFVLQVPLFSEDFESGLGNWTVTGTWGIVAHQGSNVLTDSPAGNYNNNQNRSAHLTNSISLAGVTNPGLSFRCHYDLESGYDYVYVEASATGTGWTQLGSFTGTQTEWVNQYFSLNAFAGGSVYLRFRLSSDYGENADGIYIDDVQISGNSSLVSVYGDVTGDGCISLQDIEAIAKYAIGMDPIPELDPRPWEAYRLNNADTDDDGLIDAFDGYLLCKYMMESSYLLPIQSGVAEPVNDPGLTASYNGNLQLNFVDIDQVKSLIFSTTPNYLATISHHGYPLNNPYVQWINHDTNSYAYAGYNIDQQSLYATLGENPQNFTLHYTINGVAGSQFVDVSSAADDDTTPVVITALLPNSPNPFNPETTLQFSLGKESQVVSLNIYNLKGQVVRSLINSPLPSGQHKAVWNGLDDNGKAVSSGVYLYRLQTPEYNKTRKMLLSK